MNQRILNRERKVSFMAYFRKRGVTWSYTIDTGVDPQTGKRKQRTKGGFKTKKEAQIDAARVEQEVFNNEYTKDSEILFKEFANQWFEAYSISKKISSIDSRKSHLNHLVDKFGYIKINIITRRMYQEFINEFFSKGYSDSSISSIHATGRMIFRYAINLEVIKKNPSENITLPKNKRTIEDIEQEREGYLEKHELITFLNIVKKYAHRIEINDHALFSTMSYSGLRIGETLALKWDDINFTHRTIQVNKTLYRKNKDFILMPPKTESSIRQIKISKVIIDLLKTHRNQQIQYIMSKRKTYEDNGFVFAGINGRPQSTTHVRNRFNNYLKLSNINKNITPHSLRHTHTSLLIEAGVGVKEIQTRLGHSDIKTTLDIYAHMTKDLEEKAAQKFDELMSGFLN
jgi:integrase